VEGGGVLIGGEVAAFLPEAARVCRRPARRGARIAAITLGRARSGVDGISRDDYWSQGHGPCRRGTSTVLMLEMTFAASCH